MHLSASPALGEAIPEKGRTPAVRTYEFTVVLHPETDAEAIERLVEGIEQTINERQGHVIARQTWGRRRLAYPVKHVRDGYYILWRYASDDSSVVSELEQRMRITEAVLRHLTVRAEELPPFIPARGTESPRLRVGAEEEA